MNNIRLLKTSMCLVIALLLAWQTHESSALATGLVSYWRAEGNANDSADSHNGTLMNGATFAAGKVGQAFSFNGTNAFVQVPDSAAWAFGLNDFTIDLFANFNAVRDGGAGSLPNVFIGQDEGGFTTNKWVFFATSNGLDFHINGLVVGSTFLSAPFSPTTNQWYNVAVTRSGNTYTFYVNGASIGTAIDTRAIPDANAPLTIAEAEGLGFFNGRLDEIEIYNRALSQNEIQSLSNPAVVPEPSAWLLLATGLLGLLGYGWRRNIQDKTRLPRQLGTDAQDDVYCPNVVGAWEGQGGGYPRLHA